MIAHDRVEQVPFGCWNTEEDIIAHPRVVDKRKNEAREAPREEQRLLENDITSKDKEILISPAGIISANPVEGGGPSSNLVLLCSLWQSNMANVDRAVNLHGPSKNSGTKTRDIFDIRKYKIESQADAPPVQKQRLQQVPFNRLECRNLLLNDSRDRSVACLAYVLLLESQISSTRPQSARRHMAPHVPIAENLSPHHNKHARRKLWHHFACVAVSMV
mmetsp:Transcript_33924/g.56075  ORF Transcript_33924/g.56075 Transcript_33924/m.56075 type:complete len:218 (+) Transcript_33924:545-1198(+)